MADRAVLERGAIVALKSTFVTDKAILLPLNMRVPKPPEFWTSPQGSEYASLAQPFQLLQGLTGMLTHFIGEETIKCLQNKHGTLRDVVERSSPTTQCNNVIGAPRDCWICGGIISTGELGPECEHVFPIAQALVFTGLYEHNLFEQISDEENTSLANAYISGLKKEYKWAHRICNQVKNDAHFIEYNGTNFVINDALIVKFIDQLITTQSWGGGANLCYYIGNNNKNNGISILKARVAAIRQICTPIIETVSRLGLTPQQHACSTAMYLKEYIVNDSDCGIVEEVAKTNPTIAGLAGLSLLEVSSTNAIIEYAKRSYLQIVSNKLFGKYYELLRPVLRTGGVNAANRAMVTSTMAHIEDKFKSGVIQKITNILPSLRNQLMIYLQRVEPSTPENIWSRYQVLASQILFLIVIKVACEDFNDSVKTLISSDIDPSVSKIMIGLIDAKPIKDLQTNVLGEYAQRIYNILLKTYDKPPQEIMINNTLNKIQEIMTIQPLPTNAPLPDFFQRGGTRRKHSKNKAKKRYRNKRKTRGRKTRK